MAVVYRPIRDSGSEEPHDRKCRDGSFGFLVISRCLPFLGTQKFPRLSFGPYNLERERGNSALFSESFGARNIWL